MRGRLCAGNIEWDGEMEMEASQRESDGRDALGSCPASSTLPLPKPDGLHSSDRAAAAVGYCVDGVAQSLRSDFLLASETGDCLTWVDADGVWDPMQRFQGCDGGV